VKAENQRPAACPGHPAGLDFLAHEQSSHASVA
jgi:hypothetical protein